LQALCSLLVGSYFLIKLPGMAELLALVPDKCARPQRSAASQRR
jgi:hypothetical protein